MIYFYFKNVIFLNLFKLLMTMFMKQADGNIINTMILCV